MGHYSQLYIDRLYLSWKGYIPAFLTFLFQEEDLYIERDPEDPEDVQEIGFKTTAKASIEVLDRNGYTIEFFSGIYDFFEHDLEANFRESARIHIMEHLAKENICEVEADERLDKHVAKYPKLSRLQELEDFMKFLKVLLSSDFNSPPFDRPYEVTLQDGKTYSISAKEYLLAGRLPESDIQPIDFENLQMYVFDKPLDFPPWILKLCQLFDDDNLFHYPEIISLMFTRLILASVPDTAVIDLRLHDIIEVEGTQEEQEVEIRRLHASLVYTLVDKVNLYNRVFQSLFRNESQVREKFIKDECGDLLRSCNRAVSNAERGRLLERLTELLFTSNRHFELVDKRVSTGDEEIDLVVKNGINRPFWNAMQSPLFFFECKNWSTNVGAKELRDFEGKLRNHAKLVKVGFFLSMNGFSSEVTSELKRGSREDQHIVLIEGSDIQDYIYSDQDFFSWLEKRATRFY